MLRFRGKSGKEHEVEVSATAVSRRRRRCQALPGQDSSSTSTTTAPSPVDVATTSTPTCARSGGEQFTAKDFRTWAGHRARLPRPAAHSQQAGGRRGPPRTSSTAMRLTRPTAGQHAGGRPRELRPSGHPRRLRRRVPGRDGRQSSRRSVQVPVDARMARKSGPCWRFSSVIAGSMVPAGQAETQRRPRTRCSQPGTAFDGTRSPIGAPGVIRLGCRRLAHRLGLPLLHAGAKVLELRAIEDRASLR